MRILWEKVSLVRSHGSLENVENKAQGEKQEFALEQPSSFSFSESPIPCLAHKCCSR
jgi:hypothetical protein